MKVNAHKNENSKKENSRQKNREQSVQLKDNRPVFGLHKQIISNLPLQSHTFQLAKNSAGREIPQTFYHGTKQVNRESIFADGLGVGSKIWLSTTKSGAVGVGLDLKLKITTAGLINSKFECMKDKDPYYYQAEKVWTYDGVIPPANISEV